MMIVSAGSEPRTHIFSLQLSLTKNPRPREGMGLEEGNADVRETEEGARIAARNSIPLTEEVKWSG